MNRSLLSLFLVTFVFTGCAMGPVSKNPQEYRANVLKSGKDAAATTYTVNRPYYKVIKSIKRKTKECINNKSIQRKMCGGPFGTSCVTQMITYKSTFKQGKNKSELDVQMGMTKASFPAGTPKDGAYIAVIDFVKVGKNKTKITEYAPVGREYFRKTPKAVKHWANRTNMGCPDLAGSIYK